jgi:hypothetical protein
MPETAIQLPSASSGQKTCTAAMPRSAGRPPARPSRRWRTGRGVCAAAGAGTGGGHQRSGSQGAHRRPGQAGRQRAGSPGPECRCHQQCQRSPQRPGAMVGPVGAAQADEGAPQAEGQGLVQEGRGGGDVVGQQRWGRRSGTGQGEGESVVGGGRQRGHGWMEGAPMLSRRQHPARRVELTPQAQAEQEFGHTANQRKVLRATGKPFDAAAATRAEPDEQGRRGERE